MIIYRLRSTNCSFIAVQVSFAQQNYTLTEGDIVNITLETNADDYEFGFNVTLQLMDGSATGELLVNSTVWSYSSFQELFTLGCSMIECII